jgi:hypothetical protein
VRAAGWDLRRLYWIGGSPCAGKSSVAARLATRHDLLHVDCDSGAEQRLARMAGHHLAAYEELTALGTCERLARPPEWQADRELAFYGSNSASFLEFSPADQIKPVLDPPPGTDGRMRPSQVAADGVWPTSDRHHTGHWWRRRGT